MEFKFDDLNYGSSDRRLSQAGDGRERHADLGGVLPHWQKHCGSECASTLAFTPVDRPGCRRPAADSGGQKFRTVPWDNPIPGVWEAMDGVCYSSAPGQRRHLAVGFLSSRVRFLVHCPVSRGCVVSLRHHRADWGRFGRTQRPGRHSLGRPKVSEPLALGMADDGLIACLLAHGPRTPVSSKGAFKAAALDPTSKCGAGYAISDGITMIDSCNRRII